MEELTPTVEKLCFPSQTGERRNVLNLDGGKCPWIQVDSLALVLRDQSYVLRKTKVPNIFSTRPFRSERMRRVTQSFAADVALQGL